jgi:hypothetical protein
MKRLLIFVIALSSVPFALAPVSWAQCVLSPGASMATINAAQSSAAAGTCPTGANPNTPTPSKTVFWSAGNYSITSVINVGNGVWNTGPTVSPWTTTSQPTAILTESAPLNSWGFNYASGSTAGGFQFLTWNGNHNDNNGSDGGGMVSIGDGTDPVSNFTFQNNHPFGNFGTATSGNTFDTLIYFQGREVAQGATGTDTGNTVTLNHFGVQGSSDCGPIMNITTYQGSTYDSSGGQCAAIGSQMNQTNLTISNNIITQMEQGMKFYEGCTDFPCAENTVYLLDNVNIVNNDISFFHRIGIEGQQVPFGTGELVENNDVHDAVDPAFGTWMFSLAQCCSTFTAPMNVTGNLLLSNTVSTGTNGGPGLEFWSIGSANNNLNQGFAPMQFGCGEDPWSMNDNITAVSGSTSGGINDEGCNGNNTPLFQETGNVSQGFPPTALVSVAPSISPTSGTFSGAHTVTFTDAGVTSGAGPQGNHSIWYTVDGTTPTPGSGTAVCIATGGTASISATTVKAVGMWGACNQPTSYPSGYGFVPSSAVTANFVETGGSTTPTLSSIALSGTSSILTGGTSQLTATGTLSNGTTESVTPTSWVSSNTAVVTVSSSGLVTAVAVGTANITAVFSGITSAPFAITVGVNPPEGFFLGTLPTADVNTMTVGGPTLQFETVAFFANGAPNAVITPGSWASSNTAVCTVTNPGGLVTAVSAGTCNIQSTTGGMGSSPWTITVSNAAVTPTTATPTFSPGQETFTGSISPVVSSSTSGATISCSVNGGSATTAASPATFGPFTSTTTLSCTATSSGDATSASATATYTIQTSTPTVATPTFSPGNESVQHFRFACCVIYDIGRHYRLCCQRNESYPGREPSHVRPIHGHHCVGLLCDGIWG